MNGHIVIQGAGKAYRRYASRRHKWLEVLTLGWLVRHRSQWVLQAIDMEVQPGESVGLIGYNGAGKSTLLKLVAGVLAPTVGRVQSSGRVAAILELGVGFHMELTGRENIPLAGQLMGYTASELADAAGDIMAFAELGDMIDQPLRAYSSGMLARLAFAIATAVRPDILIVDEALSVGDAYFQHKSFARIRAYKAAGTTTLFVSHDFSAVRALCDRVVLFSAGRLVMDGQPQVVLDYYNALIAQREEQAGIQSGIFQSTSEDEGLLATRSGTGEATLTEVRVLDAAGSPCLRFSTGAVAVIEVYMHVHHAVDSLIAGIMIRDRAGNPIYGTNTWHMRRPLLRLAAGSDAQACFRLPLQLGNGSYSLTVALTDRDTHLSRNFDWRDNVLVFEVTNLTHPPFVGVAYLPATVEVARCHALWDLNRFATAVDSKALHQNTANPGVVRRIMAVIGVECRVAVVLSDAESTCLDPEFAVGQDWRIHVLSGSVQPEGIESSLQHLAVPIHFDLLAINLHGNDHWVWQAVREWRPRVVVIACNGAYPPPQRWVMPRSEAPIWQRDDYYGASPESIADLAAQKGYELVCCDDLGMYLFYVRQDIYARFLQEFGIPDNRMATLFRPPSYGSPDHNWTYPHREGASDI